MIKKIKLTNFRKFKKFEIDIEKDIVVLHGDNAVKKYHSRSNIPNY